MLVTLEHYNNGYACWWMEEAMGGSGRKALGVILPSICRNMFH
jgi:hypothetical protein